MTKKLPIKLSDKELDENIIRIAKPSVKFINKQIIKTIEYMVQIHKKDSIDPVDFVNMVICATASININILRLIKNFHNANMKTELNYKLLIDAFSENLQQFLKIELADYLKGKLN